MCLKQIILTESNLGLRALLYLSYYSKTNCNSKTIYSLILTLGKKIANLIHSIGYKIVFFKYSLKNY
jgi:hypothetical protein